jgi:hypothetical protein
MRGQIQETMVEPHTKQIFDRAITTELELRMHKIQQARMEEISCNKHWQNFIAWGMDVGLWKEEIQLLNCAQIHHYLGAHQIVDIGG